MATRVGYDFSRLFKFIISFETNLYVYILSSFFYCLEVGNSAKGSFHLVIIFNSQHDFSSCFVTTIRLFMKELLSRYFIYYGIFDTSITLTDTYYAKTAALHFPMLRLVETFASLTLDDVCDEYTLTRCLFLWSYFALLLSSFLNSV